ncbi:MAG: hypothetical protein HQ537_01650 [Parcubacteria group bacterium]|nr:hypothetical protein [Parcubacteria group bacterium]
MIKLGYSIGVPNAKFSLKERIKILLSVENHAIELGFTRSDRLKEELDDEDVKNIKYFKHIYIHAPVVSSIDANTGEKVWIRYPSNEADSIIGKILEIAKRIKANIILFHPDLVDNFDWLNDKIGNLLAFENMDVKKQFGSTVNDLGKVFSKSPQAKWVCDVNHIYTVDSSMKLTEGFHQAFENRLCYYHLSGYGGFHDCFYVSREDIIVNGLKDFTKPIIHEGNALRNGKISLRKENEYILKYLKKH